MASKICKCGALAPTCRIYFFFNGENFPIERQKVWLCDDCFEDYNLYCEHHGACNYTNSPEILEIHGSEIEDESVIAICFKCVENIFNGLDDETISKLNNIYLSSEYFKASEYLLKLGETYLPKKFFRKNTLITGLVFYRYISTPESDSFVDVSGSFTFPQNAIN